MTLTMNSNITNELQELASGSFPALNNANPFQSSWSRSLSELYAANQSLVRPQDGSAAGTSQPTVAAQALLGSSRTDFSSLSSRLTASNPHRPSNSTSTSSNRSPALLMSLEDRCRQRRDGILERILRDEREHSQRVFEKAIEERHEQEWAQERQWWMQELVGKRNVVVVVDPKAPPPVSSTPNGRTLPPVLTSTSTSSNAMSSNLLPGFPSRTDQTLDAKIAMDHARILQADPKDWIALLHQRSQDTGYATAWQLLGCMVLPRLDTAIDGAQGALIHLCRQYQVVVTTRVASGTLDGQPLGGRRLQGTASMVADYCQLEKGSQASIWDVLYYCKLLILNAQTRSANRPALDARLTACAPPSPPPQRPSMR